MVRLERQTISNARRGDTAVKSDDSESEPASDRTRPTTIDRRPKMLPLENKRLILGDEIFYFIMVGLDYRSLSVVCRTTKLFHKYTVGILWRSLDSIRPLMKLFPEKVVLYNEDKNGYVRYCIPS
jgi:hypothetical protein